MIKIVDIINEEFVSGNEVLARLFSDTKAEVLPNATIVGLPAGKVLAAGSKIEVADGTKGSLKSDGTWQWNTAGGNANELPEVTAEDNGDILQVIEGVWGKAPAPEELPAVEETDEGKVLTVNSSGEWVAQTLPSPTPELPAVTPEDVGKVLTVNAEGNWVAVLPN